MRHQSLKKGLSRGVDPSGTPQLEFVEVVQPGCQELEPFLVQRLQLFSPISPHLASTIQTLFQFYQGTGFPLSVT